MRQQEPRLRFEIRTTRRPPMLSATRQRFGVSLHALGPWSLLLALVAGWTLACGDTPPPSEDWVETSRRGVARLENKESREAIEAFERAVAEEPDRAAGWRNLARAHLLARDHEQAREALARSATLGDHASTDYLRGVVALRESDYETAAAALESSLRRDPEVAPARYQLAEAYRGLDRHVEAREELDAVVRLDPLHATAHYKLAVYARERGDDTEHEIRMRDFRRLREQFGEDSRTPDALEMSVHLRPESPPIDRPELPSIAVRLVAEPLSLGRRETGSAVSADATLFAARVTAVGDDGRPTLFGVGSDGRLVWLRPAGHETPFGFSTETVEVRLPTSSEPPRLVAADIGNPAPPDAIYDPRHHAATDLVVLQDERVHLVRGGLRPQEVAEITAEAGLERARAARAIAVDVDVDGDLDLLTALGDRLELWLNDGDASDGSPRFRAATAAAGLGKPFGTGEITALGAADLDGDVLLDLVVATHGGTHRLRNLREGRFGPFGSRTSSVESRWPAALAVALEDLDADGRSDALLVGTDGRLHWMRSGNAERAAEAHSIPLDAVAKAAGEPAGRSVIEWIDLDNDGRLEAAVSAGDDSTSSAGLAVYRLGPDGIEPWEGELDLGANRLGTVYDLEAVDLDGDGDTDLLASTASGLTALRNDGGSARPQLKVHLVGTKSTAAGTGVTVRDGAFIAHRTARGPVLELGLGGVDGPIDAVRTLWPNGVVDNEVALSLGETVPSETIPSETVPSGPIEILEKNVATGSCPFLYLEGPDGLEFVTDLLGNAPLGLSIERDVPLDADPDELVWLGDVSTVSTAEDEVHLVVTEEMREVLYLDTIELVVVDHDPSLEIHPTDKLMPAPFPASELWALRSVRPPRAESSSDGVDRLAAIQEIDRRFAPSGPLAAAPLRGVTRPFSQTFDFGPLDPSVPWVLALTGWLQYGDASTNIALSQGAAPMVSPRLEVETPSGFVPVDVVVGLPAGKTKTILVDLEGHLPPGAGRLRLTSTFEVRWDRVALGRREAATGRRASLPSSSTSPSPTSPVSTHRVEPTEATLRFRGFGRMRPEVPNGPTRPDPRQVEPFPPWERALEGWATAYGDVLPLVTARDDRLALVAAGDALDLLFDLSALPERPADTRRSVFVYSVGWDKDGDANVIDGHRIEPLPTRANDASWRERWNTRWIPADRFSRDRGGLP